MIRSGFSRQLAIAAVVPATVVTVIVGVLLVSLRIADLREHQDTLGHAVASQLAPAAEYGVFAGNAAVLRRLAEAALHEADLRSVTIVDRSGQVLAAASQDPGPAQGAGPVARWVASTLIAPDATRVFGAPIVAPTTDLGEFDLPEAAPRQERLGAVEIEIAVAPALARQVDAVLTSLAVLFIGLLISTVVALRLGARIGKPVLELADAMRKLRGGDLSARVPERDASEIGLLQSGLNQMADEVERTQRTLEEQVERATSDLQQSIAALEVSNIELDLARRRALEASHLKSEFLASMSHEIRTPMSGIIGFADLLERAGLSAEQHEQVLTIRKSADTLMRIVNDILDLSRIEAGKLSLRSDVFDVRSCIDEALSVMAPLAYTKGVRVQRCVHRDVPRHLRGDPTRIQQIVTNLVSNAVKYTAEGQVSIELSMVEQATARPYVQLVVEDTGIGIPTALQHQLFQAFSQPNPTTAHHPGAGLGLVICNKLVEAMNGEIHLVSEPGEGTRFRVTLELGTADAPPATSRWNGRRATVCDRDPLTRDHVAQLLEFAGFTTDARAPAELADGAIGDLLVLGQTDGDASVIAAARRFPAAIRLLDTLDPAAVEAARAELPSICLPRCSTPAALHRAIAASLGGAADLAPRSRRLDGLNVLVVDDNRVNRALIAAQLADLGAHADHADGGQRALDACARGDYDALLLDLQMPDIDGFEVAARLAAGGRRPLIVAVTANAQQALVRMPYRAGFDAVLVKPVVQAALARALAALVAERRDAERSVAALDPEIVTMLAEDLPAQADAVHRALDAGDRAALAATLHDLVGTAAACGFDALKAAAERVRKQAADGAPADDAVARLSTALAVVRGALPKES